MLPLMGTTLITGGAGFIGSHFVELLFDRCPDEKIIVLDAFTYAAREDNIPLRILDSDRFSIVYGNICDSDVVEDIVARSTRIVHFAAESHVTRSIYDDRPFFETDVMGTQTLMAATARHLSSIEKFVHISTSEVYGTAVDDFPMTEEHPLNPCTPYAAAKAGGDRLVYAYQKTFDIPTVVIRPFNNYGPRQHLEKVIPRFITSALQNLPLTIHGDGRMTRDWIHVSDTCEGVYRALVSPNTAGTIINLGTGSDTCVLQIATMIVAILDKPFSLIWHFPPRPGQVDRHISATDRARNLLDWQTKTTLAEGLSATIDWYKNNPQWWFDRSEAAVINITDARRRLSGSY